MATILYQCPNTGFRVQGYSDEPISADQDAKIPVTCLACKFMHFVIPKTGEVVASRDPPADGN